MSKFDRYSFLDNVKEHLNSIEITNSQIMAKEIFREVAAEMGFKNNESFGLKYEVDLRLNDYIVVLDEKNDHFIAPEQQARNLIEFIRSYPESAAKITKDALRYIEVKTDKDMQNLEAFINEYTLKIDEQMLNIDDHPKEKKGISDVFVEIIEKHQLDKNGTDNKDGRNGGNEYINLEEIIIENIPKSSYDAPGGK